MLIVLEVVFIFEVLAFYISKTCSAYDRSLGDYRSTAMAESLAIGEIGYTSQLLVVGLVIGSWILSSVQDSNRELLYSIKSPFFFELKVLDFIVCSTQCYKE